MDPFQDKLLALQLAEGSLKEYPSRLLNCLKFGIEFDKDTPKDAVRKRRKEISEMKKILTGVLEQAKHDKLIADTARQLANGNRDYFDDLLRKHGLTEADVNEEMGEGGIAQEDDLRSASSQAGDELPHDDEEDEVSYELRKDNLKGFQRL